MGKDLSHYRKSYKKHALLESHVTKGPVLLFKQWFKEAESKFDIPEPNAMTLSTLGADGFPKGRVVLLKQFSDEGFVFFTNYNSEKGKAIEQHPQVSLSFFWHDAERQVIIKGKADKTDDATSDEYFNSRPRGSRLGALVSDQSEVLPDRETLDNKLKALEEQYKDRDIKRPKHWGGYIVKPVSIEFWQGRPNRLHDRLRFTKVSGEWKLERLSP